MDLTHTRLLVDDYAACYRFYLDTLGLTPTFGDETSGYADFDTGSVSLALFDRAEMAEAVGSVGGTGDGSTARGDRLALVVAVEDVDATCADLREAGVDFETRPTDREDWGIRVAHTESRRKPTASAVGDIRQPMTPTASSSSPTPPHRSNR
jgi:catechol 2,3-dioxygenase-like lactoylglutathione lyase family enzyme